MPIKLAVICASHFRKLVQAAVTEATVDMSAEALLNTSMASLHIIFEGTMRLSKQYIYILPLWSSLLVSRHYH